MHTHLNLHMHTHNTCTHTHKIALMPIKTILRSRCGGTCLWPQNTGGWSKSVISLRPTCAKFYASLGYIVKHCLGNITTNYDINHGGGTCLCSQDPRGRASWNRYSKLFLALKWGQGLSRVKRKRKYFINSYLYETYCCVIKDSHPLHVES